MLYDVSKMLTCDDDDGRKVMTVAHMVLVTRCAKIFSYNTFKNKHFAKKINSFDREEQKQI